MSFTVQAELRLTKAAIVLFNTRIEYATNGKRCEYADIVKPQLENTGQRNRKKPAGMLIRMSCAKWLDMLKGAIYANLPRNAGYQYQWWGNRCIVFRVDLAVYIYCETHGGSLSARTRGLE